MSSALKTPVTIAYGDGIGPEIMEATLRILEAAGARLAPEIIEIGENIYKSGVSGGIKESDWASLRRTRVFLKSPITTPQGGGFKSLNVTTRTTLGMFANVRPCQAYHPYVATKHPELDVVIIRENEEDLYTGIEYRQTQQMCQSVKLISRPGSEKIIRYAFEYARANNRKKVTCFSKDNIMKLTDGLFHKVFDEIGKEYPEIQKDHWIIDIGAALLADRPDRFEVIVTLNLYGDIISDIAAQVAGSVGMGGSANIGEQCAMFEAIHGSAPDIAGRGIANPSGLLNGAVMMLVHIGQGDVATTVENAWLTTIEEGIHTGDIYKEGLSKKRVGTKDFADAVIERLGRKPATFKPADYTSSTTPIKVGYSDPAPARKELVGVDIYLDYTAVNGNKLGAELSDLASDLAKLTAIFNRGTKVYPDGLPETFCTDHWRCRFEAGDTPFTSQTIIGLLSRFYNSGYDVIKTENLYNFDDIAAFSIVQS